MKRRALQLAAIVVAAWSLGAVAATTVAWRAGYAETLGRPLLRVRGQPVYTLSSLRSWSHRFAGSTLGWWSRGALVGYAGALTVVALVAVLPARGGAWRHGSGRWATYQELRTAGLVSDGRRQGVFLGYYKGRALQSAGAEHVLIVAQTGGGKTSGCLIPSVLRCQDSFVVVDPKGGEVFSATAGAKSRTHRIVRFEPMAELTARWNALDEVPRDQTDVRTLQAVARDFINPERMHGGTDHWQESARSMFVGMALHAMYRSPSTPTIGALRRLLLDVAVELEAELEGEGGDPKAPFRAILKCPHAPPPGTEWLDPDTGSPIDIHPEVRLMARAALNRSSRELGSIVSSLQRYLEPWADPYLGAATLGSTFRLSDLVDADQRPVGLYLVTPASESSRMAPVTRLLLALMTQRLTDAARHNDYQAELSGQRRRVYLYLEEFASLGTMQVFAARLNVLRGYGVTAVIVIQDYAQLVNLYGTSEPITGACPYLIATANNDPQTRERISKLLGTGTVRHEQRSHSYSMRGRNTSVSRQEHARALQTPDEVGALDKGLAYLVVPSGRPLVVELRGYYKDRKLKALAAVAPPDDSVTVGKPV